jgi:hypothetical protein
VVSRNSDATANIAVFVTVVVIGVGFCCGDCFRVVVATLGAGVSHFSVSTTSRSRCFYAVVFVVFNFTNTSAFVTIDIARVVIHMVADFALCTTFIAVCITIVIIDVVFNVADFAANIAVSVAGIIVLMCCRFSGCAAYIAVCVTIVLIHVLSRSSGFTTFVTICIAVVVIDMVTNGTRIIAAIALGIALVIKGMLTSRLAYLIVLFSTTLRALSPHITGFAAGGFKLFYNDVIMLTGLLNAAK